MIGTTIKGLLKIICELADNIARCIGAAVSITALTILFFYFIPDSKSNISANVKTVIGNQDEEKMR